MFSLTDVCVRVDMQDEVVFKTWSSNVSCGSRTTPRSLTEDARARPFPRRDILKSGVWEVIAGFQKL